MQPSRQAGRRALFIRGVKALKEAGIERPALDAAVLLGHVTGEAPETVLLERFSTLSSPEAEAFSALIRERCGRVAISRLVGRREFYSREFFINGDVLDPRPDTEILVEEAMRCLRELEGNPAVLDIGTGSGAIAVTVASELPRARVTATDISLKALAVARHNAVLHSVLDRVHFIQADLLEGVRGEGKFSAILCNPPYISVEEMDSLPEDVRRGDPAQALISDSGGLEHYPGLARRSMVLLGDGGSLIVEVGARQSSNVADIFSRAGFAEVAVVNDLSDNGRVVRGTKKNA